MALETPLSDEAIGLPVVVTGGMAAGAVGRIDALPVDPRSYLVLVEVDPRGHKLWLDVSELEWRTN